MNLSRYAKSVTAAIGAVVTILAIYGIDADPELVAAITTIVTSALVWYVPNAD